MIFVFPVIVFVYMTFWFVYSQLVKKNDVADIAWGLGFPLLASTSLLFKTNIGIVDFALIALSLLWGLRLAIHIYFRNRGKKEDFRYKQWREEWGKYFIIRTFFQVFMLQGFLMLVVALQLYSFHNYEFRWISIIGVIVYLIGLYFEAVGDFQLSEFIKNPDNKGEIMKSGLWRYTRHPNYFGEIMIWWGIFIFGLLNGSSWYTIISPITITYLLVFVSGVPMLEKKYAGDLKFEEYKKTTSVLVPIPPNLYIKIKDYFNKSA